MGKTDFYEAAILNWEFRGASMPASTTHAALFTAVCSDSGPGTEASWGGGTPYARQALSSSNFGVAATAGSIANTAIVTFPANSSGGSVVVLAVGTMTALTSGNLLRYRNLGAPVTINSTEAARFNVGALTATED